jgi:hypothetical protein
MPAVPNALRVMDVVAKAAPATEPLMGIALASRNSTKFAEIRPTAACLRMLPGPAKIVSVRWHRAAR